MNTSFSAIEKALADLQQGRMVVLFDDEQRENEGDLIIAAEKITPEAINFMAQHGRGMICLSLHEDIVNRLKIPMMVPDAPQRTPYTVTIEAASGVTTGISAADQAHTIRTAVNFNSKPEDIVMPGHTHPLRARKGGILERAGHTEGSVDLAHLAGLVPAAVICEIMNPDGTMARFPQLQKFANQYNLALISIRELIQYRLHTENLIEEMASTRIPTQEYGELTLKIFTNKRDNHQHLAIIKTPVSKEKTTLVRIHSECFTGDLFGSTRCDCGWQLHHSLERIAKEGGVLLYLRQEGRGIGLVNKLKAYTLQDQGYDTVQANEQLGFNMDHRDYWIGAQLLRHLGISDVRLLTNNPHKIADLETYGIKAQREPLIAEPSKENEKYLKTKKQKLGHLFNF